MKSILTLPFLLSLALALTHSKPYLDPSIPIHLGEIFLPPTLTVVAWLPTTLTHPLSICTVGTPAGPDGLFSLSGVDALQIRDYFTEHAHITREGKRFAECFVTPESVRMGSCQGEKDWDCEGGHRFTGIADRKWTCWINGRQWGKDVEDGRRTKVDVEITAADYSPVSVGMGTATGSTLFGAFTPVFTGM